jgi:hypothetical protein
MGCIAEYYNYIRLNDTSWFELMNKNKSRWQKLIKMYYYYPIMV